MFRDFDRYKILKVVETGLVDNTSATVVDVDAGGQGAGVVEFLAIIGATDIAATVFRVEESDDDSTYTAVPLAAFTGSALPSDESDHTYWRISINMSGRKRYLRFVFTAGNGTNGVMLTVVVYLTQLEQVPANATERGYTGEVRI